MIAGLLARAVVEAMLEWAHRLASCHGQGAAIGVVGLDWPMLATAWLARRGLVWLAGVRRLPMPGGGEGMTAVLMRIPANPAQARALVRRELDFWPVVGTRLYVACDTGHPATLGAVAATGGDPRLRIVVIDSLDVPGRADCLDRLYAALEEDERRGHFRARMIVLEDAGDAPVLSPKFRSDRALAPN